MRRSVASETERTFKFLEHEGWNERAELCGELHVPNPAIVISGEKS